MNKKEFVKSKQDIEEQNFISFAESKNITKYAFTDLSMPYDVKMRSGASICIVESKVRSDKDLSFFAKYGPFLELKKIEGMQKEKELRESQGHKIQMVYINFAKDGIQVFYLNEPWTYTFSWVLLPKDNYEPWVKVWKLVYSLKNPQEVIRFEEEIPQIENNLPSWI